MKPEEIPSWEPFLKRIPLFSALSAEDLGRIAERLQPLSLPKGATLFKQGEESDALYLIVSGHARRYREADGHENLVAYLGRGDAVGETGLLTGASRSSTVRVDATTDLLKLPRKDFEDILREHPTILLHLSRTLALRLIDSNAGARPKPSADEARLIVLDPALPSADRALVAARLGLELARQTKKRVLLVDLAVEPGAMARALGLKPRVVGEAEVRALDGVSPAPCSRSPRSTRAAWPCSRSLRPRSAGASTARCTCFSTRCATAATWRSCAWAGSAAATWNAPP